MRRRSLFAFPPLFLALALAVPVLGACNAKHGGAQAPGPSFALTVEPPGEGRTGEELAATVRVVPRGRYKINLEYPTKLKVQGPAAATPGEATLTAKQAAKLDASVILFKPAFRLKAAGNHAFSGKIRFSVCTEEQCEIKNEKVAWTAVVAGQ
jgi:hypothetical protein